MRSSTFPRQALASSVYTVSRRALLRHSFRSRLRKLCDSLCLLLCSALSSVSLRRPQRQPTPLPLPSTGMSRSQGRLHAHRIPPRHLRHRRRKHRRRWHFLVTSRIARRALKCLQWTRSKEKSVTSLCSRACGVEVGLGASSLPLSDSASR